MTVTVSKIAICGARSENIQPNFAVHCTEQPDHEGPHRTVFSVVDTPPIEGFEYSWKRDQ